MVNFKSFCHDRFQVTHRRKVFEGSGETFSKKFPKKEKFLKFLETFFKKFLSGVLRGKAPKLLLLNKIKIR